jgi:putative sterol carrier protein
VAEITPKEIFEFMPSRFNAEGAGEWKARIQFDISGSNGGKWNLVVENGTCKVSDGTIDNPTATLITSDETWVGMYKKTVNPQMAFMTGQMKVTGNIGDVLKLENTSIFKRELS